MFFPILGDPYDNNVSLLLPMEGANNSTEFVDYSPVPNIITTAGHTQILTAQSKWGFGSGYFDGTGDYLTVPNSTNLQMTAGDFTVECWVNRAALDATNNRIILTKRPATNPATEWGLFTGTDSKPLFAIWDGADHSMTVIATTALSINTWYHLAVTRQGTTLRIFINGVLEGTTTMTYTPAGNTASVFIGRDPASAPQRDFYGSIQDVRLTKGVARYTANFTPPSRLLSYYNAKVYLASPTQQPSFTDVARRGL